MANPLLFTYDDVSIYQGDLDTLKPGQWLNDQIISFSMARIEKTLHDSGTAVRFLDASLVSCLRLQLDDDDEDDTKGFVEGIGLTTSSAVVVPLTNRTSMDTHSTHWSLLYIDLNDDLALHLDSHHNYNHGAAEMATSDIYQLLKRAEVPEVIDVKCPQQENGYDCGIFTILHAQCLAEGKVLHSFRIF